MLSLEQKQRIVALYKAGNKTPKISKELDLTISVVRKWIKVLKKQGNVSTIMGRPPKGLLSTFSEIHQRLIEEIRTKNPGFGSDSILEELSDVYNIPKDQLPKRSSISNYLKAKGFVKEYEKHREMPISTISPPKEAHELWQVDGRGNEEAKGVGTVALLNIVDIFSSAFIQCFPAIISSPSGHPNTSDYQTALRLAFMEFGLPLKLQVDHASVFYENRSKSPFPTQFHLWLVGLGIDLCFSRVHRPTDQAKVERSHQTLFNQILKRDAEFESTTELIEFCNLRRNKLNYKLPSKPNNGQAPFQAHLTARIPKRAYFPCKESSMIDMEQVFLFLAKGLWFRKVASNRTISLGGQVYYIPGIKPKTELKISFSANSRKLLFHDVNQLLLAEIPLKGVSLELLCVNLERVFLTPNLQLDIPFMNNNRYDFIKQ